MPSDNQPDAQAAALKAASIAARRAARAPWRNAHADRIVREGEARETSKAFRQAQRLCEQGMQDEQECNRCLKALPVVSFPLYASGRSKRCKPCVNAAMRESYHRKLGRTGSGVARDSTSPERRRKAAERIEQLTALLDGKSGESWISSEESLEAAAGELSTLWLQSGERECASCRQLVPPTAMRPPSRSNSYAGTCNACAAAAYRENRLETFGRLPDGPRKILLKDGSEITVAEFARRCHARRSPDHTPTAF